MTAVDMKINVGSKEQWRIVDFRQPNQCSISEGCGNIFVPLKQGTDRANLLLQHERQLNNSSFDEAQSQCRIKAGSLEEKTGLGDHSLTAQQWRRQQSKLLYSPFVVSIIATKERNPWPRV
jgi:hypothetical protein